MDKDIVGERVRVEAEKRANKRYKKMMENLQFIMHKSFSGKATDLHKSLLLIKTLHINFSIIDYPLIFDDADKDMIISAFILEETDKLLKNIQGV